MEECNYTLLIEDIGLLTHIWMLHLVERLLEELFVLSHKQFANGLQSALSLGD